MSSITRAFTTRRVKMSTDLASASREAGPQRSNTTKASVGSPSIRNKISAPLELIHTTNMLSYNAPDIRRKESPPSLPSILSSAASTRSDDDMSSDGSTTPNTAASSPPTSPDVSPREERGGRSPSPEPNHLSCYFMPPSQAAPASATTTTATAKLADAPVIPQRAPSHTKKASYEALARSRTRSNSALNSRMSQQSTRTVSTKASFTFSSSGSRVSSTSTAASSVSHASASYAKPPVPAIPAHQAIGASPARQQSPPAPRKRREPAATAEAHPFGQELAQVSEIAEEYGVKDTFKVIDEEEKELQARGLLKFSADVYLNEINSLINSFFDAAPPMRHARPVAAVWI